MGHPQSEPTPVTTDNNTAHGLTMVTMTSNAYKSNGMRLQWLSCLKAQWLFVFLWARGPKQLFQLPNQASSRASPSTCLPELRSWQNSANTVNWTPPNLFVHTWGDILHSRMCDLFYFVLLVFFSIKYFSMGRWETFTCNGVLICLLCRYRSITSYYRNPLDCCKTDQPRTTKISLSASSIFNHVIHTHNLYKLCLTKRFIWQKNW